MDATELEKAAQSKRLEATELPMKAALSEALQEGVHQSEQLLSLQVDLTPLEPISRSIHRGSWKSFLRALVNRFHL